MDGTACRPPFSEILPSLGIAELANASVGATPADVDRALATSACDLADVAALLSPAAARHHLEEMAGRSEELTVRRFGRTIHMFAPLYVSNECVSSCTYCGFARENEITRTTLTVPEVLDETAFLKRQGFRHLLLVAGDHPRIANEEYLAEVVRAVAAEVPQVSIETQAWPSETYERLAAAGCDGVVLYQETYEPKTYAAVHLKGKKRNYAWRLDALDRAAQAGVRRVGAGVLLGLSENWRYDLLALVAHAQWLMKRHWRTELTVSLPRLRPCAGGLAKPQAVGDREMVQAICALRLALPDVGIVLSTREAPELRDGLARVGVTQMSAGSQTEPGGYVHREQNADPQFETEDRRPATEVAGALTGQGYDPVWKDWARV